MSKKKKNKKKKGIKRKIIKRKVKRVPKNPYRIVARNYDPIKKKEKELDTADHIEFTIHGKIYRVKINQKNQCLEFDKIGSTGFIQPVTTGSFLFK